MQTTPCVITFLQSWLLVLGIKLHLHQEGRLGKRRSTRTYGRRQAFSLKSTFKAYSLKAPCWKGPNTLSAYGRPLKLGLLSVAPTKHSGPYGAKPLIGIFYLEEIWDTKMLHPTSLSRPVTMRRKDFSWVPCALDYMHLGFKSILTSRLRHNIWLLKTEDQVHIYTSQESVPKVQIKPIVSPTGIRSNYRF